EGAAPVAVIDDALAKEFFPAESPLGRQIDQGVASTIVGVVASVKQHDLTAPDKATVYYPMAQEGRGTSAQSVAVRSALPTGTLVSLLRSAVHDVDKDVPIFDIVPMQDRMARSLGDRRLAAIVLVGFGSLALLLAAVGLYGVLSFAVSDRYHEIGIRLALGAKPSKVTGLVMRRGLTVAGSGLAIGLVT